jgi:hypothetical protein
METQHGDLSGIRLDHWEPARNVIRCECQVICRAAGSYRCAVSGGSPRQGDSHRAAARRRTRTLSCWRRLSWFSKCTHLVVVVQQSRGAKDATRTRTRATAAFQSCRWCLGRWLSRRRLPLLRRSGGRHVALGQHSFTQRGQALVDVVDHALGRVAEKHAPAVLRLVWTVVGEVAVAADQAARSVAGRGTGDVAWRGTGVRREAWA